MKSSSEPQRKLKPDASLLDTVLHALNSLISRHPTIFRPFSVQIHSLLVPIIGCTSFQGSRSDRVKRLAQELFVALHVCAPKNTSEEWLGTLKSTIASTHQAADYTFRAVIEQWESDDPTLRQAARKPDPSRVVGDDNIDALGLPSWRSIHDGVTRISTLLRLVGVSLTQRSALTISIPLGAILNLTSRLSSVILTQVNDGTEQAGNQRNPEIAREEFEELQYELPRVHLECLNLFSTLVVSIGAGLFSVCQNILDQALWIFEAEKSDRRLRTASYRLLNILLPLIGSSLGRSEVTTLAPLIRSCCHDSFPLKLTTKHDSPPDAKGKRNRHQSSGSANVDSFLNPALKSGNQSGEDVGIHFTELCMEASGLLATLLTNLNVAYLPLPLRVELDRAAILSSQKDAMLASVLNPVPLVKGRKITPSILPFLAQKHGKSLEVEMLLRPRMPVLLGSTTNIASPKFEDDDEDEDGKLTDAQIDLSSGNSGFQPLNVPSSPPGHFRGHKQLIPKRQLPEESLLLTGEHTIGQPSEITSLPTKKARLDQSETTPSVSEKSVPVTGNISMVHSAPSVSTAAGSASEGTTTSLLNPVSVEQVIPVTLSETSQSPAANPPTLTTAYTNTQTAPETTSSFSSHTLTRRQAERDNDDDEEDSGDEIPTLNVEPDTEDDDDDY